jgi:hypothetical protein
MRKTLVLAACTAAALVVTTAACDVLPEAAHGAHAAAAEGPVAAAPAVVDVSPDEGLPRLAVTGESPLRRPTLRINDTNQLRPSRCADAEGTASVVSCVTSLPWADAREGMVASNSELSQMCRIWRRCMCENYTAEDVKFTPSAAFRPGTAVRS